jgi:hypothetical protein
MKAWVRWNGEQFDAYLECMHDVDGEVGFVSHATPYTGGGPWEPLLIWAVHCVPALFGATLQV